MVEGAFSIIAEILLPLFSGLLEVATLILIASVRPWRYLLSTSFRAKTNAEFAGRSAWQKGWHIAWGTLAIAASISVVAAGIAIYQSSTSERHDETTRERLVQKAKDLLSKQTSHASEAGR